MENKDRLPDSATRLVVVLEANDQIQLAMAKGLLEDAGIPLFIQGQIATLYQSLDGFLRKWVSLQVPEDRAVEAQELLEQLKPRPFLCRFLWVMGLMQQFSASSAASSRLGFLRCLVSLIPDVA